MLAPVIRGSVERVLARAGPGLDADAVLGTVLAYADAHDGVAVMDDTYGRDVAASEGITTRGTSYLVLKLAKEGVIAVDDARTVIDAMIDEGWYCAPDVYS